jgi:hypothetical protein
VKVVLALIAMTAVAHADARSDVEKTVRSYFTHASDQAQLEPLVRGDAVLVVNDTYTLNAHGDSSTFLQAMTIKKVDSIAVHVDDVHHAAWFKGVVVAMTNDPTGDSCHSGGTCPPPVKLQLHIAGLAIDEKGWKLQAIFVTQTMSDGAFFQQHRPSSPAQKLPTKLDAKGDMDLLAAAKTWIAGGLAAAAATGSIYAQGIELAEIGVDARAKVLAGKWDKLKLWPSLLDTTTFGDIGFVYGIVGWPVRGDDIPLRLAAIAVKVHGTWKWLVLDLG